MKKVFLALAFALAIALPSHAQFRYGPTAGIDITNLKFSQKLFTVDQSVGAQAGLQCEMMFPGIGFGIDFGLMYAQRGATLHLGERMVWASDGYTSPRSYLHYIEIPINLRYKYTRLNGLEDVVAPYVYGGPSIAFLAGHNRIEALHYAGSEIGLQCGIGAELFHNWQIQAGYTWGMSYAVKTIKLDNFTGRNRSWSVRLTYLF